MAWAIDCYIPTIAGPDGAPDYCYVCAFAMRAGVPGSDIHVATVSAVLFFVIHYETPNMYFIVLLTLIQL